MSSTPSPITGFSTFLSDPKSTYFYIRPTPITHESWKKLRDESKDNSNLFLPILSNKNSLELLGKSIKTHFPEEKKQDSSKKTVKNQSPDEVLAGQIFVVLSRIMNLSALAFVSDPTTDLTQHEVELYEERYDCKFDKTTESHCDDWDWSMKETTTYSMNRQYVHKTFRNLKREQSKKGIFTLLDSENDIMMYFNLWHMLRTCSQKYRSMASSSGDVLAQFTEVPQNRHKKVTPDLGILFFHLLISSKFSLEKVFPVILDELLTRNVLWALNAYPELSTQRVSRCRRITSTFDACFTSLRIIAFHCMFYRLAEHGKPQKPRDRELLTDASYDFEQLFSGRTITESMKEFSESYDKLWNMQSFIDFFGIIGIECSSGKVLETKLLDAMARSEKLDYHKKKKYFDAEEDNDPVRKLPKCCCRSDVCLWN